MKIPKHFIFAIVVMIVGKVCGYSEESIIDLVKLILGFGIIINAKFIKKNGKIIKEYAIRFFTKN